jgi:hypothetical protein
MTTETNHERTAIINALRVWLNRRPGLPFADYCDEGRPGNTRPDPEGRKAYASDMRRVTRDRADGLELLAEVERRTIPAEAMLEGFRAYSGRLSWQDGQLDYTPGQYGPTERREAACAVLREMLWNYWREDLPLEMENKRNAILKQAKIALRPALYRRWFA